ncbi:MAG: hypothetical protein ACREIL_00460 [Nitrospiraceae bacterium]
MIQERYLARKTEAIKALPCHTNRASELGHPCTRYLYFVRAAWQKRILHSPTLQSIFDIGKLYEEHAITELKAMGFRIIEQQRYYEWKKYQITGHVDGKLYVEDWMVQEAPPEIQPLLNIGHTVPMDVKSCESHVWERLNTVEDLLKSPKVYHQKYVGQLTIYALSAEEPVGVIILVNKQTGVPKEIWIPLNYDYGEGLIKKAETVNAAIEKQEIPPPIPWSEDICGACPFLVECLPEVKRQPLELLTDPELEGQLIRLSEIKPLVQEYEKLDKTVKGKLKGQDKVLIGDFLVTGSEVSRTGYTVKPVTYWQVKIDRLSSTRKEEADD